jgi:hypothetical protein
LQARHDKDLADLAAGVYGKVLKPFDTFHASCHSIFQAEKEAKAAAVSAAAASSLAPATSNEDDVGEEEGGGCASGPLLSRR